MLGQLYTSPGSVSLYS